MATAAPEWKGALSDPRSDPAQRRATWTPTGGAGLVWGLRCEHVTMLRWKKQEWLPVRGTFPPAEQVACP